MSEVPYSVIDLKFKAIGDVVVPYNNGQYLETIDQELERLERVRAQLLKARAILANSQSLNDMVVASIRRWMKTARLEVCIIKPPNKPIQGAVYFYTHPRIKAVKIGFSDNLPSRIRGIDGEVNRKLHLPYAMRSANQPVVYIPVHSISPDLTPDKLEECIHYDLQRARIEKEWFDAREVIQWLRAYFSHQSDYVDMVEAGVS